MKRAKRFLSLLLPLVLVMTLLPAAALAADDTITVQVRVFDQTGGKVYEVGTDTVKKVDGRVQSEAYTLKQLSAFTRSTCKSVDKVVGNWYFPVSDQSVGSTVYFSNNASTATITYWVTGYVPYTEPVTPPGTTTPPTTDKGSVQNGTAGEAKNVEVNVQVVLVNYAKTSYTYGDKIKVKLDCQSSYCKHTQNCSVRLVDFHPESIGLTTTINGYKWVGWSKSGSKLLTPEFETFYTFQKTQTTNLANPSGCTFYLIYQDQTAPTPGESGADATAITLTFKDRDQTATKTGVSGDTFTMPGYQGTDEERSVFLGWSKTANATSRQYSENEQVPFTSDTTLHAVWRLYGDLDGDGIVTYRDAMMILECVDDKITLTDEQLAVFDYNGDGDIDALDAQAIMNRGSGETDGEASE